MRRVYKYPFKPEWTTEELDAAHDAIEAAITARAGDHRYRDGVYRDRAVLDLLAGLRQDIANFLRDPNIIETPSPYLEHLLPLLRDVMEAAAQGVEARPLLPSDGPPAESKETR